MPAIISSCSELDRTVFEWKRKGLTVAVVPTMGALHAGHLSLVDAALRLADRVVATIFVNPTQFAPTEDLANYPRTLEDDISHLRRAGVHAVFIPGEEEIYPAGFSTFVDPPQVSQRLEGQFRPAHFRGVATVVLKLLNMTRADVACFGQKDFQQTAVIQAMVRDLNIPCRIAVCPIVRDPDGLALSSRNRYLSKAEREQALGIFRTLEAAREQIESGERDGHVISQFMMQNLIDEGIEQIDYALVAHPQELTLMDPIEFPAALLIAARVGRTRLIDNCLVGAS